MKQDEQPQTLGDALPVEMARVRDKVLPVYVKLGPPGAIAAFMMRASLDNAARALASGDVDDDPDSVRSDYWTTTVARAMARMQPVPAEPSGDFEYPEPLA